MAEKEGYALGFGCVSGDDYGAMGLHYINGDILNGGEVDVNRPQIVIYEPQATGEPRLIGADYLVFAEDVGQEAGGPAAAHGTALSLFREPQSLRTSGLLHAARLGVEGQSQRRVRELASQRFVPVVRRTNYPLVGTMNGGLSIPCKSKESRSTTTRKRISTANLC